jgi:hypothetical protein
MGRPLTPHSQQKRAQTNLWCEKSENLETSCSSEIDEQRSYPHPPISGGRVSVSGGVLEWGWAYPPPKNFAVGLSHIFAFLRSFEENS